MFFFVIFKEDKLQTIKFLGAKKLLPFHIFYSAVFKRLGKRISRLFTIKGPTYLKQVHDGSEAGFEGEFEVKGLW